jgi:hypothetical protein
MHYRIEKSNSEQDFSMHFREPMFHCLHAKRQAQQDTWLEWLETTGSIYIP